jgi:hypothetical protein
MATRAQIDRLAQRIEVLATRFAPPAPEPPPEWWSVEGDRAWQSHDPDHVITFADLKARPAEGARMVSRYVHADNGRPAACCSVGGSCYAVHGPISAV